jgi:pyruvate-formate lyase-activating enzyme
MLSLDRRRLYRFPWSLTDNPGGWVEVTDRCNLACPGCYRKRLGGDRPLDDVRTDIAACQEITNCDCMAISGGEPLIYPHIVEVVDFIASRKMKPLLLTNGLMLDRRLAVELKKAGLVKFNFHVDSAQERPGWESKSEPELNSLRQYFADFVWDLKGVQCGFNATVSRANLADMPEIVGWARQNIHKVQHLSLIVLRGLPISEDVVYTVHGEQIEPALLPNSFQNAEEITISSEDLLAVIQSRFPEMTPCAYLSGTTAFETNKYLVFVHIGSARKIYGLAGAKTIELVQVFHHFFKGRYNAFSKKAKVGRIVFLLSLVDPEVKRSFLNFLRISLKNPWRLFDRVYSQPVVFEQPLEIIDGEKNLCDGCINAMVYKGRLIPSCRLDEYRVFGGSVVAVKRSDFQTSPPHKEEAKGV